MREHFLFCTPAVYLFFLHDSRLGRPFPGVVPVNGRIVADHHFNI
jgi:hypothetical protein